MPIIQNGSSKIARPQLSHIQRRQIMELGTAAFAGAKRSNGGRGRASLCDLGSPPRAGDALNPGAILPAQVSLMRGFRRSGIYADISQGVCVLFFSVFQCCVEFFSQAPSLSRLPEFVNRMELFALRG